VGMQFREDGWLPHSGGDDEDLQGVDGFRP
jgi:hypothetical protein